MISSVHVMAPPLDLPLPRLAISTSDFLKDDFHSALVLIKQEVTHFTFCPQETTLNKRNPLKLEN